MTVERGTGRPRRGYKLASGQKVPGTTTIVGRFKESGGLIRWAYKRGLDGLELYESRDKAADLGTHVHDAIETQIHGGEGLAYLRNLDLSEVDLASCEEAFGAFEEWHAGQRLELIATEVAMVSEEHRFGGTLDAVAVIAGKLCLLDWKTSNGVYRDYITQLGAYAILWSEVRKQRFEGAHLLRVSKKSGAFAHHFWPQSVLAKGARLFLRLRDAYELDYQLKEAM